jgi:hypothetical protein
LRYTSSFEKGKSGERFVVKGFSQDCQFIKTAFSPKIHIFASEF